MWEIQFKIDFTINSDKFSEFLMHDWIDQFVGNRKRLNHVCDRKRQKIIVPNSLKLKIKNKNI